MHLSNVKAANGRSHQPVCAGRKGRIELGLVRGQLVDVLDFVEVKRKLARDAAVEARLQVGGPVLVQDVLAAGVLLADARDPRVHCLAAVDVLDGRFAEEKVHVLADVERTDKVGLWKDKGKVGKVIS